jgi:phosphoribosyl-ATP pyrophosphohydrolase/phosphoribosyl-AMP cyclohydrolase
MSDTDVDEVQDEVQFDEDGLVPAIAQDARTGEIRMLAYMNEEALDRTKETGYAHYWSRSREELWKKGETSGQLQEVQSLRADCDMDTVLVRIEQQGDGSCHTGARNCFYNEWDGETWREVDPLPGDSIGSVLGELESIVRDRDRERPEGSYTTSLIEGEGEKSGLDTVLEKLGEEMTELIISAKNDDTVDLEQEIGDLLYHLIVLCRIEGVELGDVASVLNERRR